MASTKSTILNTGSASGSPGTAVTGNMLRPWVKASGVRSQHLCIYEAPAENTGSLNSGMSMKSSQPTSKSPTKCVILCLLI